MPAEDSPMPLITDMHRSQLPRSGMALGGIGAGWFEIRQDGGFANWSIFNNWPLFPGARYPHNAKSTLFFVLWVRVQHENPRLVLLQIEDGHGAGAIEGHEFQYMFPWMSGVDAIRTTASFPFADLDFRKDGLPLAVSLRAWSPFIPGNAADSSLPLACFDFRIVSHSDRPVEVQILAVMRNVAAYDQPERIYQNRRIQDGDFSAVVLGAAQTDPLAATTGELCLASFDRHSTAYMGWEHHHPYYERLLREFPLPEIDDTDGRNGTDKATGRRRADPRCFATIGRAAVLARRGEALDHGFALTWHFPNLYGRRVKKADSSGRQTEPCGHDRLEGHFYSRRFASAEAVARYAGAERGRLLAETTAFHRTFFDSSLPGFVLDQINSQLNTLRTSTWLTATGMFGVLEGLSPIQPWAGIATTDVAAYGQIAVSLLFPELDRMTIDIWRRFQQPNGCVIHSVSCNSYEPSPGEVSGHRLDMPAQFVFLSLRAALWSQDRAWIDAVWPDAKRALDYVLRERDANGDQLPDMQGIMCSYDNFPMHGVAPFVVSQWLAAVALALETARRLGDRDFLAIWEPRFTAGRATLERTTWNGRYFDLYSDTQAADPEAKRGCMTDQLIGDGLARALGLPPLVDPAKAASAFAAIMRMNFRPEQGLRNCQWPGDQFLHPIHKDTWVDQANTCWSGVELLFAAQLYAAGRIEQAEAVVRSVDERYRDFGMYWDHQEFGGHYFRPLSALAIPGAVLGQSWDGATLRLAPVRPLPVGRWCVLLPGAYGTWHQGHDGGRLELLSGSCAPQRIEVPAVGTVELIGFAGTYRQESKDGRTIFTRAA
ncbi:MAG TPA: hypothetical protein DCS97_13990 [Planctomycetes bacterium]|nr:hypothetical protein [Planctomycetota bacterium]